MLQNKIKDQIYILFYLLNFTWLKFLKTKHLSSFDKVMKHTKCTIYIRKHTSSSAPSKSGRSSPPMLFIICRKGPDKVKTPVYLYTHTFGTVHVQNAYLWEFVKTRQVLIRVIFPVFPIIEINTQPVELRENRFKCSHKAIFNMRLLFFNVYIYWHIIWPGSLI